ncbi:glycosyltransferase [Brevibacterium album]|uniref:glycosyltransferase n=1 Tax=Brevibacterium album TaxID=417948 RepID=UPI0003F6E56D|nr:glycosyltransferase [Brevibacterium album]
MKRPRSGVPGAKATARSALAAAKSGAIRALPDSAGALLRSLRPMLGSQARVQAAAARSSASGLRGAVGEARRSLGSYRRARAFEAACAKPLDPRLVVWESFGGNGALCNPAALFREVVDAPDLTHLTHVWMLRPEAIAAGGGLLDEFADHPRVRTAAYRSPEYFALLERATVLVNNATFPVEYVKRDGQVYLNTWHGTPLKHMGYDEPDGAWASRNVLRNFLSADYLLSSGPYMTERMYRDAYRLEGVFSGLIVEDGSPRTDLQFAEAGSSTETGRGVPVLLYAPTWRGKSFRAPQVEVAALAETLSRLRSMPELEGWEIRLKVHQSVYAAVADDPRLAGALVENSVETNALLARTRLLVTDFSSIFMDALATDIPVVFFAEDHAEYLAARGTYVPTEDLPGPVTTDLDGLSDALREILAHERAEPRQGRFAESYAAARQRWVPHDDGGSAARLADLVFRGRAEAVHRLVDLRPSGGKARPLRLVVHLGGLKPNGISTSALGLLSALDPQCFDVTAVYPDPSEPARREVRSRIPRHIRQLPVGAGLDRYSLASSYTRQLDGHRPATGTPERDADGALWRREWRRIAGEAQFDVAIDFSGYSAKWARMMLTADCGRSLLWMHNDLLADSRRVVSGALPYSRSLRSVFALLKDFDGLVSVSSELAAINAENLRDFADAGSFLHARNTIDAAAILAGAGRESVDGQQTGDVDAGLIPGDLDSALDALLERYGRAGLEEAVERRSLYSALRSRRGEGPVFVTVGRMSPEKNHARLLEAFARVLEEQPEALLVLVGDGPLREELEDRAEGLGIAARVMMTGRIPHPYVVLSEADCFVLSSDYEGQPMVILEALVLGLPVISTAFGSVRSALPPGSGRVVERSAEALAEAMLDWRSVPAPEFDAAAYNAEVVEEFAAVVSGRGSDD